MRFVPGGRPNASPTVTRTEGAICTTQIFSGSCSASQTIGVSSFSTIAPVGQCAEHWPHFTHGESASVMSPAGAMRVLMPRSRSDSAQTFCTSWRTRMQRPHLMHFWNSRMIEPVERSGGASFT